MLGELRGSIRVKINAQISSSKIFVLGQMIILDAATFISDSTDHHENLDNFSPCWIIRFSNLEYSDSRGELILQGLASTQIQG